MNTTTQDYKKTLRDYPCILNCCTVNWFTHWPSDALYFISETFLKDIEFTDEELQGCIKVSKYFHTYATERADELYRNDISYNCVTPASFLELNSLFKTLLTRKRDEVNNIKQRFTTGLDKLKDAAGQVGVMQEELEDIQPHLTAASKEVDKCVALVEKDQNEVSELEKVVKNVDSLVSEKTKQVKTIIQECEDDLQEVARGVESALEELSSLSQQEFAALRSMKQPTPSIRLVMEAFCILTGVKPDKLPDGGSGGKMIDDYWGPSKRLLGEPKFVADITLFEKDDINPKTMKLIREKYLSNSEIDPDESKQSIGLGEEVIKSLYKWLTFIESYDKAAKVVAPKREAVVKLNLELEESTRSLKEKQAVFDEANEKLKIIQSELATKKTKKAELENEVETCSRKLERAEQLIGGLGGERDKWAEIVGNLGNKYVKLTGDILLSSALIAYLGVEEQGSREYILKDWMEKCQEFKVPFSADFSLYNVLGDEITRQSWQLSGLPSDQFSTDNGIIAFTSKRWVLMLDPQEIGKKWIQAVEKNNNLQVLKQSDSEFLRNLESSIQFGQPALLENVGESLDPILEPLLTKQTFKQGGSVCLKLGDSTLEYHKDFKLYITTKLKKPKLDRDTVSKVALINFSITRLGLDEQLLTITVTRERPELEEERAQLIVQANDNRKQLRDIENKILDVLYTSKGNILEDENAIKILSSSKILANEISEKQNIALDSKNKIDENREPYLQVAAYVGVLFFAISDLSHVCHMYQYSLNWFINLFCNSVDLADKSEEMDERLESIKDHMTQSLYQAISRGLFNEDKNLFSFLLCVSILKHKGDISDKDWKDYLSCISEENVSLENSDLKYFETRTHGRLNNLKNKRNSFEPVLESILSDEKSWYDLFNTETGISLSQDLPHNLELDIFEKLMLNTCINTKDLVSLIYEFVELNIGRVYTQFPLPDFHKAYLDSNSVTPIVLILGDTADPCSEIYRLAERLNIVGKRLQFLCLGSGKERQAEDLIKEGIYAGNWVILQNCHMVPGWLSKLEFMCEGLDEDSGSPDFRLWLTTKNSKGFPIPILQNCIKVSLEEQTNLKSSVLKSFPSDIDHQKEYEKMSEKMKRMSLSVTFFHSMINEKTRFKTVGWNQHYVFPTRDKLLSLEYLQTYLTSNHSFSLKSISSFLCNCIVGSGIEDIVDSLTLNTILNRFCNTTVVQEDVVQLDKDGVYKVLKYESYDGFVSYLSSLPQNTTPDMLSINRPIYDRRNIRESQNLLNKILISQDRKVQKEENFSFHEIKDKVETILKNLPGKKKYSCFKKTFLNSQTFFKLTKELSPCHKLRFSNTYIFATQCRRP